MNERADNVSYPEDVGAKDFKMGATGLLVVCWSSDSVRDHLLRNGPESS